MAFDISLYMQRESDPVGYLKTLVESTTNDALRMFREPPKDIERHVRVGLCQILQTSYDRPDANPSELLSFGRMAAEDVSKEINIRLNFDEFVKKSMTATAQLSNDTLERRKEFQNYVMSVYLH